MRRHRLSLLVILLLSGILLCPGTVPAQQGRGMGVPAADLPKDLQNLDVKDYFLPSDFREVGVIHGLNGQVVVVHRGKGTAYFGKPGDKIYENDELNTLGDSRCRIRFFSDDVVNMAPETNFAVETFEDQRQTGKKDSLFSMAKGKAMFYALRLFRYKESRFKVKTPTAVVGVRGTKFGIDVFWLEPGKTARARGIQVADSGRGFDAILAQNQAQGLQTGTRAACGDGTLDIFDPATGQPVAQVNPNEEYNSYTGQTTYDPTNPTLNRIQNESQVRDGEGEGEGEPPTQPGVDEGDSAGGGDTGMPDNTVFGENQTDISQQQTGENTLTSEPGGFQPFQGTSSAPLQGYFSAFLFYRSTGHVRQAFASMHLQSLDPLSSAQAKGASESADIVTVSENAGGQDVAEVTLVPGGTSDPFSFEGRDTYLGQYSYLQWGYSQSNTAPTPEVGGTAYEFINKFWFVNGYPTCPVELASLSGDYTYSGGVNGTYYSPSAQVDLTGTYTSQVHFGSSYIHDFQMNASGGGHSIDFTQAGSATINSDGEFQIGSGTFNIDGSPLSSGYWVVNGAHFGPGAAEQGGAFAGYDSGTNTGTHGIFYGKRN